MHFAHCNGKFIIYFIVIITYNQQNQILIVYKLILVTYWPQNLSFIIEFMSLVVNVTEKMH